jgi:hypothetical protein
MFDVTRRTAAVPEASFGPTQQGRCSRSPGASVRPLVRLVLQELIGAEDERASGRHPKRRADAGAARAVGRLAIVPS